MGGNDFDIFFISFLFHFFHFLFPNFWRFYYLHSFFLFPTCNYFFPLKFRQGSGERREHRSRIWDLAFSNAKNWQTRTFLKILFWIFFISRTFKFRKSEVMLQYFSPLNFNLFNLSSCRENLLSKIQKLSFGWKSLIWRKFSYQIQFLSTHIILGNLQLPPDALQLPAPTFSTHAALIVDLSLSDNRSKHIECVLVDLVVDLCRKVDIMEFGLYRSAGGRETSAEFHLSGLSDGSVWQHHVACCCRCVLRQGRTVKWNYALPRRRRQNHARLSCSLASSGADPKGGGHCPQ